MPRLQVRKHRVPLQSPNLAPLHGRRRHCQPKNRVSTVDDVAKLILTTALKESKPRPLRDRLVSIVNTKLADHVREMKIDRAVRDPELVADLDTCEATGRELQTLALAQAERCPDGCGCQSLLGDAFHEQLMEVLAEQDDVSQSANDFVATFLANDRR